MFWLRRLLCTKEYCAICRIAVDFNDIERICDFAQFKFDERLKIRDQLKPYVKEAEDYGSDDIKQLFDKRDKFCFSHRHSYAIKYNYRVDQKFDRDKKKWVNKIILNRVINFFRKVKVKNWLTISLLLKRVF